MDRKTGAIRKHDTDAMFVFHVVHAFETPESTVVDVLGYDDASIISALSTENLLQGFPDLMPTLRRLTIDRASGKVRHERIHPQRFEVPQIDWEFVGQNPETVVFGSNIVPNGHGAGSEIVRVDLKSGEVKIFSEGDWALSEPIFVGAPQRTREADGILLTVGSSQDRSALFVLDATTLEVRAQAAFDVPLPLGFHGSFVGQVRK